MIAMFIPRGAGVLYELTPLHRQKDLGAHKLIASMGMLKRSGSVEIFSKTEEKTPSNVTIHMHAYMGISCYFKNLTKTE